MPVLPKKYKKYKDKDGFILNESVLKNTTNLNLEALNRKISKLNNNIQKFNETTNRHNKVIIGLTIALLVFGAMQITYTMNNLSFWGYTTHLTSHLVIAGLCIIIVFLVLK